MRLRRLWWFVLLALIVISLIIQQVLTKVALVQAQTSQTNPPSVPARWTGYKSQQNPNGLYPDAVSACKSHVDNPLPPKVKFVSFDKLLYDNYGHVYSATCTTKVTDTGLIIPVMTDVVCPIISVLNGDYTYTGTTKGNCILSPAPRTSNEGSSNVTPDYSPCTYYDNVANQFGCKYHQAAAGICRGNHDGVTFLNNICSVSQSQQNCIRQCLVENDKKARNDVNCRTNNGKGNCTKKSCINDYHNICFPTCGVNKNCYGGNWDNFRPFGDIYSNDGDV